MSGRVGQNTASSVSRRWVMWQRITGYRGATCLCVKGDSRGLYWKREKLFESLDMWSCREDSHSSSSSKSLAKIVQENFEEDDICSTSLMMDGSSLASISLLNWQQAPAKSPRRDVSPEIHRQNSQGREDTSIIWFELEIFLERVF